MLTESGSHALDMLFRVLLVPGDVVLVDDPCYFNFHGVLRAHKAQVIGVPYTPNGPDLEAFDRLATAHQPKLYVTNSALHNPTGASLSPASAHRVLKLATAHDFFIIEDDIYADFELDSLPRLAALDGLDRVIYIGSFSKTLSAAARCGYVAARADWIEALFELKLATMFGGTTLAAELLHRLLTNGGYRRHVDGVRVRLATAMTETTRRLKSVGLMPWTTPRGGMFLWASLPQGMDSASVSRQALAEGIIFAPGNVFSVSQSAARYMRFNVAQCGSPRIFEFLRERIRDPTPKHNI